MPNAAASFGVVFQQIVGNDADGFRTSYSWDGERFPRKRTAVSHGFRTRGSDDFNIVHFGVDGEVLALYWMDKPLDHDVTVVADHIGCTAKEPNHA